MAAATDDHNPDFPSDAELMAYLTVAGGWCAPPPRHEARIPRVGENWRGAVHGSLYHVLAVEGEMVTYLVMYQGNPYWREQKPPGSVCQGRLEGWLAQLEYAPEWNIAQ